MAQQSGDKLAKALLDPSSREVLWPVVFAGVKNVVRANNVNNDTLTCIKGWLKSNDSQLHIPLLGLTVLHTMTLNCSTTVRNQLATQKLFQRLEKQLARPQGPQVATAIVQVLVDWAQLFSQEELGMRSRTVLAQSRYSQMAAGCTPSLAVVAMQEEMRLGIPPVAPIRGEDFIRWMYRGASLDTSRSSVQIPALVGSGASQPGSSGGAPMGLPGGAPPPMTTQEVPQLCHRMQADATRLTASLATCRSASRSRRTTELTAAMDAGYREAERCSQWRRRVQDFTQQCDDPRALSSVLASTDVINQALQDWQQFTGREVYDIMRITVPAMPPEPHMPGNGNGARGGAAGLGAGGRAFDIADLLGMGHAPAVAASPPQQPPQPRPPAPLAVAFDPFGVGRQPSAAAAAGGSTSTTSTSTTPRGPAGGVQLPAPSSNPFAAAAAAAAGPPPWGAAAGPAGGSRPMPMPPGAPPGSSYPRPAAGQAPGLRTAAHQSHPSLSDWDPFGPTVLPPQFSAGGLPGAGGSSGGLPGAPSAAGSSLNGNWALFGEDQAAPSAAGSYTTAPYSPGLTSSQPSGIALSPSVASVASVSSTPRAGGSGAMSGGLPSPQPSHTAAAGAILQPFSDLLAPMAPAATPHYPATTSRPPSTASGPAPTSSQPQTNGTHHHNGPGTSAAGTAANGPSVLARSATMPSADAASGASASGDWVSGGRGGVNIKAGPPPLEWRPDFNRLAAELRALVAPSSSSSAAAQQQQQGVNGALLPAVLSRVQELCEALAAQHARVVGSLAVQHAAEVLDVKSCALQKLREVMGSAGAAGAAAAAAAGSGAGGPGRDGGGQLGPSGAGAAVSRPATGAVPRPQLGPLHQGLQQQPQQQQQRPNGLTVDVYGSSNGRSTARDSSLI